MHARVPQAMAQFVLKIELLSHIMGTTPILEMARAYGLRPRLWLLLGTNDLVDSSPLTVGSSLEHLQSWTNCVGKCQKHEIIIVIPTE